MGLPGCSQVKGKRKIYRKRATHGNYVLGIHAWHGKACKPFCVPTDPVDALIASGIG